jgi:hypothetical protein
VGPSRPRADPPPDPEPETERARDEALAREENEDGATDDGGAVGTRPAVDADADTDGAALLLASDGGGRGLGC